MTPPLILLIPIFILSSCGETDFASSVAKEKRRSVTVADMGKSGGGTDADADADAAQDTEATPEAGQDQPGQESDKAMTPGRVTGTYLTCQKTMEGNTKAHIGCEVMDKNGKVTLGTDLTAEFNVTLPQGSDISYKKITVPNSKFHVDYEFTGSNLAQDLDGISIDAALADDKGSLGKTASFVPEGSSTNPDPLPQGQGPVATQIGAPTGENALSVVIIFVRGYDITHYQYFIGKMSDSCLTGAYSPETSIEQSITENVAEMEGGIKLCLIGKNSAGVWQDKSVATFHTWVRFSE